MSRTGNGAQRVGAHAVVIGASVAGLLAGRVLSDGYERVTIVERDELPPVGDGRKAVPQAPRHAPLSPGAAATSATVTHVGPQLGRTALTSPAATARTSRASQSRFHPDRCTRYSIDKIGLLGNLDRSWIDPYSLL